MRNDQPIDKARIPEAVERINQLRQWWNDSIPAVARIMETAKPIGGGSALSKKDMEKLRPILDSAPFRAFVTVYNGESCWLRADIHFPVKVHSDGGSTVKYYELSTGFSIGSPIQDIGGKMYPLMRIDDITSGIEKLADLRGQIDRLENEADEIIHTLGPILGNN